jgi:hypothetical protein
LFRLDGIVRWLDAADTRLRLHPPPGPASLPAVPAVGAEGAVAVRTGGAGALR